MNAVSAERAVNTTHPGTRQRVTRRWATTLAVVFCGLIASSCRADVVVDVTVNDDVSGTVEATVLLDAEAAEGLRDLDENASGIPLEDLAESGWEIEPPTATADGGTRISATKNFGGPGQLTQVLEELGGEGGIFRDFQLQRAQSFGQLSYALIGQLDVSGGFDTFGDVDLAEALSAEEQSLQSLAEYYGATEEDVGFTLRVTMPGQLQNDASSGSLVVGETSVTSAWAAALGDKAISVALATTERSILAQVLRGASVVAGVLTAIVLLARLLRAISNRRRARARPVVQGPVDARGRAVNRTMADDVGVREPELQSPELPRTFQVVALDGMGVLYSEGDDINRLLVPFARSRGSTVSDAEVVARARAMSVGRMTTAAFWPSIGVFGDPGFLDNEYLALHQLTPGVVRYLRRLRSHGIRAACITNDSAEWANKLRISHSLDSLIDQWVVSGSVGVRKPDGPIFEVLRRVTGVPPELILVVDDNLDTLDAARAYGFGTAWFAPEGDATMARGHELMRSFDIGENRPSGEAPAGILGEAPGN